MCTGVGHQMYAYDDNTDISRSRYFMPALCQPICPPKTLIQGQTLTKFKCEPDNCSNAYIVPSDGNVLCVRNALSGGLLMDWQEYWAKLTTINMQAPDTNAKSEGTAIQHC